jgi:UDP-N-acetylglucosamine 2-epimerase (non-hydrolysing)
MRLLSVFGTRPEAIKMAPVVKALEREPFVTSLVCVTGQHREMLDQALDLFGIEPDMDLQLMSSRQTLNGFLSKAIDRLDQAYEQLRPDRVLVHGDTTTAMAAALAAFQKGVACDHVEAGLRTYALDRPFPEEMNRRYIDVVSSNLFAPTEGSRVNLQRENVQGRIFVTGNTGIDALHWVAKNLDGNRALRDRTDELLPTLSPDKKLILVTGHRRESFGSGFIRICTALAKIAASREAEIVYPVHLNPSVRGPVENCLGGLANVHLVAPLSYLPFVRLMQRADIILTDSGGVQEEAPSLGKPVLVMRDLTERPEAVAAGTAQLVGTEVESIVQAVAALLRRQDHGLVPSNPYGDGKAAERISDVLAGRPVREFACPERVRQLVSV